jgi:hypothetical protein
MDLRNEQSEATTLFGEAKWFKRVEASTELTQILNDLEAGFFDGITTGDEFWFQDLFESSVMFQKWLGDVVPRTRKGIGVAKTMVTIFFTNKKF